MATRAVADGDRGGGGWHGTFRGALVGVVVGGQADRQRRVGGEGCARGVFELAWRSSRCGGGDSSSSSSRSFVGGGTGSDCQRRPWGGGGHGLICW